MIQKMGREHIVRVSEIDVKARAGDFLPSLGERFLRTLYAGLIGSRRGLGYVYLQGEQVVGFIIGSFDTKGLFREVLWKRGTILGLHLLVKIFKKPSFIKNTIQTFRYPRKESHTPQKAELIVIGVDERFRGRGIGEKLIRALNQAFLVEGISSYKVTVNKKNESANKFYQRLNFKYQYTFSMYGREWNLYTCQIETT